MTQSRRFCSQALKILWDWWEVLHLRHVPMSVVWDCSHCTVDNLDKYPGEPTIYKAIQQLDQFSDGPYWNFVCLIFDHLAPLNPLKTAKYPETCPKCNVWVRGDNNNNVCIISTLCIIFCAFCVCSQNFCMLGFHPNMFNPRNKFLWISLRIK